MKKDNQQLDSNEELWFTWWLDELKDKGYVKRYRKLTSDETFILFDGLYNTYDEVKQLKTKTKITKKTQTILNPLTFMTDFEIVWNYTALNIFFTLLHDDGKRDKLFIAEYDDTDDEIKSIVEIKGDFDFKSKTVMAVMLIKMVMDKYGCYINLIKLPKLFDKSFTPKKYFFTPTGRVKKIKYKNIKTIEDFLYIK